jgi:hypothetical protein
LRLRLGNRFHFPAYAIGNARSLVHDPAKAIKNPAALVHGLLPILDCALVTM